MTPAQLTAAYGLPHALRFEPGPGGLTVVVVDTPLARGQVALHGAHVLAWRPAGAAEVLWLSRASHYTDGKPIRGGIPVCWPWFGAHPTRADLPGHGFARLRSWAPRASERLPDGGVRLTLGLADSDATRALWPNPFDLQLTVEIGTTLRVALRIHNPGDAPWGCSCALHTYFGVADVRQTTVTGLEGRRYLDTVEGRNEWRRQDGPVLFDQEVDRLFPDTGDPCVIHDPVHARRILVAKEGSRTTVVWNPWIAKAARMPDFGGDEYPGMLCVEAAYAGPDALTLHPGATHTLATTLTVQR